MSARGLLRDAGSDVQEVPEDSMDGKVTEGRKVGNGNYLTTSDMYIYNHPESTCAKNFEWKEGILLESRSAIERSLHTVDTGNLI